MRSFSRALLKGFRRPRVGGLDNPLSETADVPSPNQPVSKKAVGAAALWSMGNAFTGQAVSLLAFLVTARLISPAAFGTVAVATLAIEIVKRLLIEPIAIKLLATNNPDQRKYDDCFSHIVTLSAAGSLFLALLAEPLAWVMRLPDLPLILYVMAGMLVGNGLSRTHDVWYSKRFEFRLLAVRTLGAATAAGLSGVVLALLGFGVWALVAQQVLGTAVACILLFVRSTWRPRFKLELRRSVGALIDAQHYIYANVLSFVGGQADVFFVTSTLGASAGGIYSAAKRLILAANMIVINAVQNVILASFAERSQSPRAYHIHLTSAELFALVITPPFVGLALLSHDVIAVLLSAKWLASAEILSALSYGALAGGVAAVVANHLMTAAADKSRTAVIAATALLTVAALPFVARGGAVAVAWFSTATSGLSLVALSAVAAVRARVSLFEPLQAFILPLAGGAAMLAANHVLDIGLTPLLRLVVLPPLLLCAYLIVVGLLALAVRPETLSLLKRVLGRGG